MQPMQKMSKGDDPVKTSEAILTTGQIAKFCHVDARTVNRWIDKKLLKAHELPITRFRRIRTADFVAFLHQQGMPIPQELSGVAKKRILIVDDDRSMAAAMRRLLGEDAFQDCVVDLAYDGFEAGRVVEKAQPHLMVLDLKMPGMDGFEVCRRLKSQAEGKTIRILAVSGAASNEERKRILKLGADDFMEKPFDPVFFKKRILELLNLRKGEGKDGA
jgi:CheY-like chemotaxis protein